MADYANIELIFKVAYALGMAGVGRLIDQLGTKLGYAFSTTLWSLAAVAQALTTGTLSFRGARRRGA